MIEIEGDKSISEIQNIFGSAFIFQGVYNSMEQAQRAVDSVVAMEKIKDPKEFILCVERIERFLAQREKQTGDESAELLRSLRKARFGKVI